MTPPAAVSQEWRLELAQRAHSTVSSGDQESFGVETAKRVLGESAFQETYLTGEAQTWCRDTY